MRPTYDLQVIKRAVRAGRYWITELARENAGELELDERDIVRCVLALGRRHFRMTAESERQPGTWQDVYETPYEGMPIYLKLQLDRVEQAVVIDFKRAR